MRTSKALIVISGIVLTIALTFVPKARASEQDQATQLTFSQPIQIPGHEVLPAGTYWFIVPDNINMPNLVQIWNADRSKLIATVLTNSVDRQNSTTNTELVMAQSETHQPDALVNWFYPDDTIGHQFLYFGKQQRTIDSEPKVHVMATQAPAVIASYGD